MGPQHTQQFIDVTLFVRHVGCGLHAPNRIKAPIRQIKRQGIHDRKPTMIRQFRGCQGTSPGNLGRTDTDCQHIKTIVKSQKPSTTANTASHIQNPTSWGQAIEPTPTNQFMDEVIFGQTKIAGPGRITIKTKVNMITPKAL